MVRLSPPSRYLLEMCVDCYLNWYNHNRRENELLKELKDYLTNHFGDLFIFNSIEIQLLIDSIHGMEYEFESVSELERKAYDFLIVRLQQGFPEEKEELYPIALV